MKKNPLRTCVGCQLIREKKELIRIILDEKSNLKLDLTGKTPGRGAYLCQSQEEIDKIRNQEISLKKQKKININKNCFQKALDSKSFDKAFKKKTTGKII